MRLRSTSALLLLLVGCAAPVGEGKPQATISDAPAPAASAASTAPAAPVEAPTSAAAPPLAPAGEGWVDVDLGRSRVMAVGAKITKQHELHFDRWSGKLQRTGTELSGVAVTIDMNSVRSDGDRLTNHLKSPDFFDVAVHPTATFVSEKVEARAGETGQTHVVTGALTLRGVTKTLSFPATAKVEGGVATTRAEFVINRHDFGVVYPGKPDDLIQDSVALTIDLVATVGG